MDKIDLNKDKIKAPFKAPDEYFEKLTGKIQERITVPESNPQPYFRLKWVLAPASILILAIALYFYPQDQTADMDQLLAGITDDQIEAYLELNDISEYEIAQLIDDAEDLVETNDYLEGIEMDQEDLENLIIDFNEFEQNIGS
ncbi:MAG: hypothetical protein ACFHWX_10480 [Bacteroidota bacterium]